MNELSISEIKFSVDLIWDSFANPESFIIVDWDKLSIEFSIFSTPFSLE